METKEFFVDQTLYKGRPDDTSGRLEKETRVYDLLDSLGIEYLTNKTTGYLTGSWALDEAGINSNWKGWLMSFILLPLQCILLIFCVKTNSSIATHKFPTPFFLLWCILIPIQKILPVTYRFVEFIYPFIFLVFAEIIITTLNILNIWNN